jgi:uncharacterized protein (TIGR02145 family)
VATNENGFSVLMGGNYARGALGSEGQPFNSLEKEAEFWTSTSDDFTDGKIIRLWYEDRNVTHSTGWKNAYGCSVRCVKDY